jgi:DNA-binding SARP family transcriptional activator
MVWISGPGGCGKVTLVAQYLEIRSLPALWYKVEEGDSDRNRVREFSSRLTSPTVVVFTDVHTAGTIPDFLEALPEGSRIIVLSREPLPSDLGYLRSRGLVAEITWRDLRLTMEEAAGIAVHNKIGMSEDEIQRLHTHTNGWIAGFILHLKHGSQPNDATFTEPSEIAPATALPLTINTLGRFELVRYGEPLRFSRKAPKRVLELLKFLVAQGGRPVHPDDIISAIWPEALGDTAQNSFTIALHRLRRLLGSGHLLQVEDGTVSLDRRHVRVDAWEFEELLAAARESLGRGEEATAIALIRRAVALYRGHFLPQDSDKPWSVAYRDRLRGKFTHNMGAVCRYLETCGEVHQAIACYQDGLQIDHLSEAFYQQLMLCYLKAGLHAEAAVVYDCCRKNLAINLTIAPSLKTTEIYRMITARQTL